MIIFYDINTKEIKSIEDKVMLPSLPQNMTFDEKVNYYKSENTGFIALPYELGTYTWDYNLCFDVNEKFVGIQPKGGV